MHGPSTSAAPQVQYEQTVINVSEAPPLAPPKTET
jgi:hypothetical protein